MARSLEVTIVGDAAPFRKALARARADVEARSAYAGRGWSTDAFEAMVERIAGIFRGVS